MDHQSIGQQINGSPIDRLKNKKPARRRFDLAFKHSPCSGGRAHLKIVSNSKTFFFRNMKIQQKKHKTDLQIRKKPFFFRNMKIQKEN